MTKLSDLQIKAVYDTDDDVREFYNSTLSCAVEYKRASAYFSDGFYLYIEKGLSSLLRSGGKMKLILSTEIDNSSLEAIKKGYELKENKTSFINDCIKHSVFDFEKVKKEMSIISYLIAIDKLDIRFVFKQTGLYHDKFAIISDFAGNKLLLSGSNNETMASVSSNHESFETTLSWNNPSPHEIEKINTRVEQFDNTWNNEVSSLIVLPMTEVLKEKLIDKINYDKVSHIIPNFDFIRMSIDEENCIRIQTNVSLSVITSEYKYRNLIKYFVDSTTDSCIKLKPLALIKDIISIKESVESIANKNNIKFVLAESLINYIEKYYLDLKNLALEGERIKDKSALVENTDFLKFCERTQSLIKRPLKTAQLQAAYHITKMRRSMNFSVPGSGKTSSILGAFEYLNSLDKTDPNHIERILVLGPLNCFKAWKEEFAVVSKQYSKFDPSQIIDIKNAGDFASKNTLLKYDFPTAKIVLINFDIVTSVKDVLSSLVDKSTMIVFDEIHRIKNYTSEKLPACLSIVDKSNYRVALTGTPLPNGYQDLYAMFSLLYGEFAKSYFGMHLDELQRADKEFEENGVECESINNKIYPFFVRVTKDDLEVPKANDDHLVYIDTNNYEKQVYTSILKGSSNSFGKTIRLVEVGCLPEIAGNNYPIDESEKNDFIYGEDETIVETNKFGLESTSKINKTIDLIKTIDGKIVVWCIFTATIEKLFSLLNSSGIKAEKIYGITGQDERSNIIDIFNNTDDIKVLITNPHTLAESVSLHKSCHAAIYMELNYNLAQYLQSRDRIHRLGLHPSQETDYFIMINKYSEDEETSIDYAIYKRLIKKEKPMKNAIDRGALLYKDGFDPKDLDDMIADITKRLNK